MQPFSRRVLLLACSSHLLPGAAAGKSMMESHTDWTRWKVSHPMVADIEAKGESSVSSLVEPSFWRVFCASSCMTAQSQRIVLLIMKQLTVLQLKVCLAFIHEDLRQGCKYSICSVLLPAKGSPVVCSWTCRQAGTLRLIEKMAVCT